MFILFLPLHQEEFPHRPLPGAPPISWLPALREGSSAADPPLPGVCGLMAPIVATNTLQRNTSVPFVLTKPLLRVISFAMGGHTRGRGLSRVLTVVSAAHRKVILSSTSESTLVRSLLHVPCVPTAPLAKKSSRVTCAFMPQGTSPETVPVTLC